MSMGLRVSDFSLEELKGKRLVDVNFVPGSEYVIFLEDREGNTERHRVPAVFADLLEQYFWLMTTGTRKVS